jgi:hypothetical protein
MRKNEYHLGKEHLGRSAHFSKWVDPRMKEDVTLGFITLSRSRDHASSHVGG